MLKLTQDKIQLIESRTIDLLKDVHGNIEQISIPVKLDPIMKKYGLKLKVGNFGDEEISGYYDKEKKLIAVSDEDSYNRQIFTLAHELGHFFLHRDLPFEIIYRRDLLDMPDGEKSIEQEANWFAASLLMPRLLVINYSKALWNNVSLVAEAFGVSNTAAYYRMKNLGLIKEKDGRK